MKLALALACALAATISPCRGQGLNREPIGAVGGYTRTDSSILVSCTDHSEVRLTVLAPDLIRVRASFGGALPPRDHSWAIARTDWPVPPWKVSDEAGEVRVVTDEIEVAVRRSPLLVEFRDPHTHRVINADQRPMSRVPASGGVVAAKRLALDEHFYGLGEKAAHLDKRRGVFTMWTSDTPGYVEGTDPIYQSIPFYLGWEKGEAYGIFFDNSFRTRFDFGSANQEEVEFSAEGGEINYYFFRGPSMRKILGRYADLTGHMPLPPLWALGNHQSRYSYYPDTMAEEIVRRYRADDLPLDVLHLDIHYMNGYRDFTWDLRRFPDPDRFVAGLRRQGVRVVTIVDPGIKLQPPAAGATDAVDRPEFAPQDQSFYVYNQGNAGGYFLRRKSGEPYVGRVWPGDSVFVDYTIDAAAQWWGDLHRAYTDHGVAGIWTDMNEPADFVDKSGKSQADVISYDGGAHTTYAQNRNVFALGMSRATYEGLQRLRPHERPFVITRAGYAGIQRYATMWTGDNTCTWESLALSLPMFESLGLSGEPFVGADIPGFRGNADGELLVRWYQVGFLAPLCRNHAENRSSDHEPWRFGTYYEDIVRKYLKLRYRLLPFLYTTLEEAHRTGVPWFRPMLLNYQTDENLLTIDDEFMVGADLLAAPILKPGQSRRRLYLPAGRWYDFWSGAKQAGGVTLAVDAPLDTVPLFVRGGAILPVGPAMNYVGERPCDPLRFEVYPDDQGNAATTLYEDDGITPAYQQGAGRRVEVNYARSADGALLTLSAVTGSYRLPARTIEFVIHDASPPRQVLLDGQVLEQDTAGKAEQGWSQSDRLVTIRVRDDATAHRWEIR